MTSDPSGAPAAGTVSPGVAALQKSLTGVVEATHGLRGDVQAAERARLLAERATRRTGRINIVLTCILAVLVAAVLAVGWQNKRLNDRIADCTTVGGKCYAESQQRTAAAIVALTRISIYVSQCGRLYPGESGPEYDQKIEACVAQRLAQNMPPPPAN